MPKASRTKPAAATEARRNSPNHHKVTASELRHAEVKRQFEALRDFAKVISDDIDLSDFEELRTFKLILDRDRGSNTPIEQFITQLVLKYRLCDEDGEGMTLNDIEWAMNQLRDADLPGEIERAHWMSSRYVLPEKPEATEEMASN